MTVARRSATRIYSNTASQICFLSTTYEGKANDKSLADLEGYTLAPWKLSLWASRDSSWPASRLSNQKELRGG